MLTNSVPRGQKSYSGTFLSSELLNSKVNIVQLNYMKVYEHSFLVSGKFVLAWLFSMQNFLPLLIKV